MRNVSLLPPAGAPLARIGEDGERSEPVIDLSAAPSVSRTPSGLPVLDLKGLQEWPKHPTLIEAAGHYITEHFDLECQRQDPANPLRSLWRAFQVFGPLKDIRTLTRGDGREFARWRRKDGVCEATIRRDLAFISAACNHERREERITAEITFHMPKVSESRVRWLTREEHARLMRTPMPSRLYRFYIVAFGTGARSRAIEECKWSQVDFERRTIDFRIDGHIYKNKRRVVVPISNELLPRLVSMYERRKDDWLIGLGPSGRVTTTYHQGSAVIKAAGIEGAVPRHVARHTFASWLLQRGVSIYRVALLMGDKVAMIEKVYGHLAQKDLLEAINHIQEAA